MWSLPSLHPPDLSLALAAVVPLASVEFAKATRWQVLLGIHRLSFAQCLRALLAGQLTNSLSPLRAGEAVILGVVAAHGAPGGTVMAAAGALAGVKAIDAICFAAVAVLALGTLALAHPGWSLAGGGLVIALGILLAVVGGRLRTRLEGHALARKLRLVALIDVAETLHDRRAIATVLGTSAVAWLAGLVACMVVLASVGIAPTLHLAARMMVGAYLAALLPAPPARLGVFEAGITVALTSAGVPLQQAVAAAVTMHICQFLELGLLITGSVLVRRWSWSV